MDNASYDWESGYTATIRNQAGRIAELEGSVKRQPRVPKSELLAAQNHIAFLKSVISGQASCIQRLVAERDTLIAERNK